MADFTRGPFDSEPVSWELQLILWWPLGLFDTVLVKALCKATICISDTTGPTCLDVEIFACGVFVFLVDLFVASHTSSAKSWHVLDWDSATVIHAKNSTFSRWVLNQIAQLELKLEERVSWFVGVQEEYLLLVLSGSVATTVKHNEMGRACCSEGSTLLEDLHISLFHHGSSGFLISEYVLILHSKTLGHLHDIFAVGCCRIQVSEVFTAS